MCKMSLTIFFVCSKKKLSKAYPLMWVLVKVTPLEPYLLFIMDYVVEGEAENSTQQADVSPAGNASAPQRIKMKCRGCVCLPLLSSLMRNCVCLSSPSWCRIDFHVVEFCFLFIWGSDVDRRSWAWFFLSFGPSPSGLALVLSTLSLPFTQRCLCCLLNLWFSWESEGSETEMKLICTSLGMFRCRKQEQGTWFFDTFPPPSSLPA